MHRHFHAMPMAFSHRAKDARSLSRAVRHPPLVVAVPLPSNKTISLFPFPSLPTHRKSSSPHEAIESSSSIRILPSSGLVRLYSSHRLSLLRRIHIHGSKGQLLQLRLQSSVHLASPPHPNCSNGLLWQNVSNAKDANTDISPTAWKKPSSNKFYLQLGLGSS
jgi:hypothetical protein